MIVTKEMPEGWKPGRCLVECDISQSCPFSRMGCWVRLAKSCPLYKEEPNGCSDKAQEEV